MMPLRWIFTEKSSFVPQKVFLWAHLLVLRSRRSSNGFCHYSQNRSLIYFHPGGSRRWAPGLPCRMKGAPKGIDFKSNDRNRSTIDDFEGPGDEPREDFLRYKGRLSCGKPPWRLHSASFRWSEAPCATSSHSRRFL